MAADREYEPIAIIGVGLELPGGCSDASSFHDFCLAGGDAVVDVPSDRWDEREYYSGAIGDPGMTYTRRGAFLDTWDYRSFDASEFGVSAKDASQMDPQQRLLLETALRCLDDAYVNYSTLHDLGVGVFVGGFMMDHMGSLMQPENRWSIDTNSATSATMTMLSNRLSYVFDLTGPSMTIDTACSSSLVSIHQACRALQNRDANLCLAGGVNFMSRPETTIMLCKGQFLARDGRSKSFDESADGYGRGEGCVLFALKRHADAVADRDKIFATVLGTGVNQDGTTSGITVPSRRSQSQLSKRVLEQSGVPQSSIDLVEAHGTGTPIGDPIEIGALSDALGSDGPTVALGSAKAGIGHLEAAAGASGLLRAALAARARVAYPQAWLETVNPELHLESTRFEIPVGRCISLGRTPEAPVTALVSSFGYGGTNAHAIVSA